jgi:hypothetical protein
MSTKKYSLSNFAERNDIVYWSANEALQTNLADGVAQKKIHTFQITDRNSLWDYANGYFDVSLRLERYTAVGDPLSRGIPGESNTALVNGIHSLIKRIQVQTQGGRDLYNVDRINEAIALRKLVEQTKDYAETVGPLEYYYVDKVQGNDANAINVETGIGKRGHSYRSTLWEGDEPVVRNFRIPLKWFSWFHALDWHNVLIMGQELKMIVEIDSDANLVYTSTGGFAPVRVVLTEFKLALPLIILKPTYDSEYLKLIGSGTPIKWRYLAEVVEHSNPRTDASGVFKLSNLNNPRHVFIFFNKSANYNAQTGNFQYYDKFITGGVGGSIGVTVSRARLRFSDGSVYPKDADYEPALQTARMYGDVLKYSHALHDLKSGSQLSYNMFTNHFPFFYFDLTYQKEQILNDARDMTFEYTLTGGNPGIYEIVMVVLQEHEATYAMLEQGKYILTDEIRQK